MESVVFFFFSQAHDLPRAKKSKTAHNEHTDEEEEEEEEEDQEEDQEDGAGDVEADGYVCDCSTNIKNNMYL
jgi:hypothetical protein